MPGQLNAHAPAGVSRREVKRWQARQWGGSLNPVDVWELLGIQQDTGTVVTLFGNMRAGVFRTVGALSDARTSRHAPQYRGWPCPLVR